jgi:3-vinyl bacteriochlorophyllide hydratase
MMIDTRPGPAYVGLRRTFTLARSLMRPAKPGVRAPLYTPDQRRRRDASRWTVVQGVLAPLQFLVMLVSTALVIRYLWTGAGWEIATASVLLKTAALYAIMVTGSIWEKEVFGRFLFAPAFFWEDVVSMAVLALHTAYLFALAGGMLGPAGQMWLALAAYAAYAVNAGQFLWKLRMARLEAPVHATSADRGVASLEVAA